MVRLKRLPCLFLPKEQTMFYDLARRFMFTRDADGLMNLHLIIS